MVERTPVLTFLTHLILLSGVALTGLPLIYALIAATHPVEALAQIPMPLAPGDQLFANLAEVWERINLGRLILNTFIVAMVNAIGTIVISMASAFAIVYYRLPIRGLAFWLIFCSLMVPVEVRIVPTYEVVANMMLPIQSLLEWTGLHHLIATLFGVEVRLRLNLLNTYVGLTLPMLASATSTFLFRQYLLTLPDELAEAAKIDGAGPWRFFISFILPLSKTTMAAIFIIQYVVGWNQYLWPLLVTTTDSMQLATVGVARLIPTDYEGFPEWHLAMAGVILILIPPVIVVMALQRYFVHGMLESGR